MFSPHGNKKVLLQIKRAQSSGLPVEDVLEKFAKQKELLKVVVEEEQGEENEVTKPKQFRVNLDQVMERRNEAIIGKPSMIVSTTSNLVRLLSDPGLDGVVMNRVMESTNFYMPERDGVLMKSFESKSLDYANFRHFLHSSFRLVFQEPEFASMISIFDPCDVGHIDGYQFIISFKKLKNMKADRFAAEVREKQDLAIKQQKDEEQRKLLEAEKKMEFSINYDFDDIFKEKTMLKLEEAAKKFDPCHPSSPNLDSVLAINMKPAAFRELLIRTFNLKLDRTEMGVILREFDKASFGLVPCGDFFRNFFQIGAEARERDMLRMKKITLVHEQRAKKMEIEKLEEAERKMAGKIDYDFSMIDEARAEQKLKECAAKYDRGALGAKPLDSFGCEYLLPGAFREALRRTFDLNLTNAEMGYLVRKFDKDSKLRVDCGDFLVAFLRMGIEERELRQKTQLERQRLLHEKEAAEAVRKTAAMTATTFQIDFNFKDAHLKSVMKKLTAASTKYDTIRGNSLQSFAPIALEPKEFQAALQRTFNLFLSPPELGAIVCTLDKEGDGKVHCQSFLNSFMALGKKERDKKWRDQLVAQREAEREIQEKHELKLKKLSSKVEIDVDFDFTDEDADAALLKMNDAAKRYDVNHPSCMGLEGFAAQRMEAPVFKEMVRRTFGLKLTGKEVGALIRHFGKTPDTHTDTIDCNEFTTMFLKLGFKERGKVHKEVLIKQREAEAAATEEHRRKVSDLANRSTVVADPNWTDEDAASALEKLGRAAEGFDKNHPASPSLKCFEGASMTAGLFKENLKRVFSINLSIGELGFLMNEFDKDKGGTIDTAEFLVTFFGYGKKRRAEKHTKLLEKQRRAEVEAKKEAERLLAEQWAKAELKVVWEFDEADRKSALDKMRAAGAKYDKSHPSSPSLAGFQGGPMTPGIFRELVKRSFNLYFTPKELAAVAREFQAGGAAPPPTRDIQPTVSLSFDYDYRNISNDSSENATLFKAGLTASLAALGIDSTAINSIRLRRGSVIADVSLLSQDAKIAVRSAAESDGIRFTFDTVELTARYISSPEEQATKLTNDQVRVDPKLFFDSVHEAWVRREGQNEGRVVDPSAGGRGVASDGHRAEEAHRRAEDDSRCGLQFFWRGSGGSGCEGESGERTLR